MRANIKFLAAIAISLAFSALNVRASDVDPNVPGIAEKKIEDITRMVSPSVVKVEARDGIRKVATGVVIDRDGYIATTALISPRDQEINVITADGKRIKAEFKGFDTQTQIALVQAKDKSLAPISFGKSADLKPGAWIGVIGLSPENAPAVWQGIVSSLTPEWLRLNVWVVPGSSGSPVVNETGKMVGLLRGTYADEQPVVFEYREQQIVGSGTVFSRAEAPSSGMALAVPVEIVSSVAADIKKSGKVERGWLGVTVTPNEAGKLYIVSVVSDSPAELAKLKPDDVILKMDGQNVTTGDAFESEIRRRKPGTDVILQVERNGKPMDIKVKLGEYSEEQAKEELQLRFPRLFPPRQPKIEILPKRQVQPKALPQQKIPEFRFDRFAWENRRYIGARLQELNKDLASYFGVKEGLGLLVTELTEDGPAKRAGLKVGDVIVKVDGKSVETVADLSGIIQDKKKGDKIKVEFLRDKKAMALDVEVGEEGPEWESFFRNPEQGTQRMTENMQKMRDYYRDFVAGGISDSQTYRRLMEELQKDAQAMTEQMKRYRLESQNQARDSGQLYEENIKRMTEELQKRLDNLGEKDKEFNRVMRESRIYYRI
jgi:serine protease Do